MSDSASVSAPASGDARSSDLVTLFHAPQTRSSGTLFLLSELGAPHDLHLVNLKAGEQKTPAFLAVNPMGKVPAIRHRGEIVTEQVAISLYLADLFPDAGLAPGIGDRLRGAYLRWFVFYGSCFEPALVDRATKREPAPRAMNPYGDFDTLFGTLLATLRAGPYMLGERFSALDVLWGSALSWMTQFRLLPEDPAVADYVERITSRPAWQEVTRRDAELAATQAAAAPPPSDAPAAG